MIQTGHMDDNHPITVLCTKCGAELTSYVAVCSPGNSQPALYVEPCENCCTVTGDRRMKLRLLGPRRNVGQGKVLELLTSAGWMTLRRISEHPGVRLPTQTIRTRIGRYGITDDRCLDPEHQTHHPDEAWNRVKSYRWDRRRCRRDGMNCVSYAECQNRRLGLTVEPWVPPADTDQCYVQPDLSHLWGYASSLAEVGRFGLP